MLDETSAGQLVLGDMSRKVDWDPFLFPFMGAEAPGLDNLLEMIGDLPKIRSQMGEVMMHAIEDPQIFVANKHHPKALKAQKAMRALINDISMFYPTLGLIPLQAISSAAYYLPDVMSGSTEIGIPSPYGLGTAKPLVAGKLKKFEGANLSEGTLKEKALSAISHGVLGGSRGAAIRQALRLPMPADVSLYRAAETGLKLGKKDQGLKTMKRRSGIH